MERVEARRTRASLTRLVVELAEASEGGLKTLLARTLDDDTLEIAYPVGADRFADATGAAIDLPPRDGRAATAIVHNGATAAVVVHRQGLLDDAELVEEVAVAARLALDNEWLQAEDSAAISRRDERRTVAPDPSGLRPWCRAAVRLHDAVGDDLAVAVSPVGAAAFDERTVRDRRRGSARDRQERQRDTDRRPDRDRRLLDREHTGLLESTRHFNR